MKKLITSVFALVAFANYSNAETSLVKGVSANMLTAVAAKAQQFETSLLEKAVSQPKFAPIDERVIVNPEMLIALNYERPIEEVIAENKKIIETDIANEDYSIFIETPIEQIIATDNQIIDSNITSIAMPLYLERTIEDAIAEDNAITEGIVPTEATVLNFDIINKNATLVAN